MDSKFSNLDVLQAKNALNQVIDDIIRCSHCHQNLRRPFVLPCGHTVCIKHVYKNGQKSSRTKTITCKVCGEYHQDYETIENEMIKDIVDVLDTSSISRLLCFLNDFDINKYDKNDQKHSKIRLESLIIQCEIVKNDPFELVYKEVNEIMNYVQLKKELNEGKNEKIKDDAERLIAELTAYRNQCREHLNTMEFKWKRDKLIEDTESQLKACLKFLEIPESNEDMTRINEANNKYIEIINHKFENFIKNELLLNKLSSYKDKMKRFEYF